jgi:hypothetical protein
MERRDQQQQQRQQQGVAPFSIVENWQEPVDMYLLRSIGSSIVKPGEGSRLSYRAVFSVVLFSKGPTAAAHKTAK